MKVVKSIAGLLATTGALTGANAALADSSAETEAVVSHHLEAFSAGDVEAVMSDYTAESVMMTQSGNLTGPDELRPAVEDFIAEFAKPGANFELLHMTAVDEIAYIVWQAETADNVYEIGTDTFLVQDGKIITQTFTVKAVPKN